MRYILLIMLGFTTLSSFSQTIIRNESLPIIIEKDTVIIDTPVWIESEGSEIRQRGRESKLRRKLISINSILLKKKFKEMEIDSLLNELTILNAEKDSLSSALKTVGDSLVIECKSRLLSNADEVQRITSELTNEKAKVKKLKRKLTMVYLVLVAETAIIILLL
jgi:hypothetical protein